MEEIEWNLNQGFGILLLKLIDDVNKASLSTDMDWFNAMRLLFRNIEGIKRVNVDYMIDIDKKMLAMGNKFNRAEAKTSDGRAFQMAGLKNLKKDLDEINRDLMRTINEAQLIKFHIDRVHPSKSILK